MPAGRPRSRHALPPHIDGEALPRGIYWHPQRRCWYIREGRSTKRVAGEDARLSDLHAIAEARGGVDPRSLRWLAQAFAESPQHAALSPATRKDYAYCAQVLLGWPLRDGRTVGELHAAGITRPLLQRLVDRIGEGGPSKAAHVRRWLSRVWEWGANRGHVPLANPAAGIEMPAERARRRSPEPAVLAAVLAFAQARGALGPGRKGAVPGYLWAAAEIAYACRLRGAELLDLSDASATDDGLVAIRRKGSRTTVNRWSPRLRAAWDALLAYRAQRVAKAARPTPMRPQDRRVLVAQDGAPIGKRALDNAWQRLMKLALEAGVVTAEQRFGLHDLKRRGITDTVGTRADKQEASGHRSGAMMDVYDLSTPLVEPAGG